MYNSIYALAFLALGLVACSGQASFQTYSSVQAQACQPQGATKRYVSYQINMPVLPSDFAEDIDGDGRTENAFASLTGSYTMLANAGVGSISDSINVRGLAQGKGLIVLEVTADDQTPACASVGITVGSSDGTLPRFDGSDQLKINLGHHLNFVPAQGIQGQLETTPYTKMLSDSAKRAEILLPVDDSVLHLTLYGVHITINKIDDNNIEGRINGIIKKDDIDRTFTPFLAREMSAALNKSPNNSELQSRVHYIEIPGSPISEEKCKIADRCCRTSPATCRFLPAEMRQLIAQTGFGEPDVQVFEGAAWHPVPNGTNKDGFSVGIGFKAVAADFQPSCPAGSFCPEPPVQIQGNSRAAWASRMSDAWILFTDGRLSHFDGLTWRSEPVDMDLGGTWAMGGRSYDDIWTGTSGILSHWDGAFWNKSSITDTSTLFRAFVPDGPSGFLAVASSSGSPLTGGIFSFDGTGWLNLPVHTTPSTSVMAFMNGDAWAVGPQGQFSRRQAGIWNSTPPAPPTIAYDFRALWGSAPNDLWALGSQAGVYGACFHFDGTIWETKNACPQIYGPIRTAWGSGANDIWATVENGSVAHYQLDKGAATWTDIRVFPPLAGKSLWSVFGAEADVVWVTGTNSGLLRYQP